MTDDVKRALEAAARHMTQVQNPNRADMGQAAAAIAAFLREIAKVGDQTDANLGAVVTADVASTLAAAVERAAKEAER